MLIPVREGTHAPEKKTKKKVKGHQRSKVVNYVLWLLNLVRRFLMRMMTFISVKGQQRSNVVIYVIWLPHLVRCIPSTSYDDDDLHKEVIKDQIVDHVLWLSNIVRGTIDSN